MSTGQRRSLRVVDTPSFTEASVLGIFSPLSLPLPSPPFAMDLTWCDLWFWSWRAKAIRPYFCKILHASGSPIKVLLDKASVVRKHAVYIHFVYPNPPPPPLPLHLSHFENRHCFNETSLRCQMIAHQWWNLRLTLTLTPPPPWLIPFSVKPLDAFIGRGVAELSLPPANAEKRRVSPTPPPHRDK